MEKIKVSKGDKFVCIKEVSFHVGPVYYNCGDIATILGISNIVGTVKDPGVFLTCKVLNIHGGYEFSLPLSMLKTHFSNIRYIRKKKLLNIISK